MKGVGSTLKKNIFVVINKGDDERMNQRHNQLETCLFVKER